MGDRGSGSGPSTCRSLSACAKGSTSAWRARAAREAAVARPAICIWRSPFRPHPLYKVDGKDVFLELPAAPWEAALGARVKVPTPSGAVDLTIPAGSSGGRKLRLKGRGIPARETGDFYVVLQIALPKADSEPTKRAYEALAQATRFSPRAHLGG